MLSSSLVLLLSQLPSPLLPCWLPLLLLRRTSAAARILGAASNAPSPRTLWEGRTPVSLITNHYQQKAWFGEGWTGGVQGASCPRRAAGAAAAAAIATLLGMLPAVHPVPPRASGAALLASNTQLTSQFAARLLKLGRRPTIAPAPRCSAARPKLSGPSGTVHPRVIPTRCLQQPAGLHIRHAGPAAERAAAAAGLLSAGGAPSHRIASCSGQGDTALLAHRCHCRRRCRCPPTAPVAAGRACSRARMDTAAAMQNLPADQQQQLMTAIEQMQVRDR